MAEPEGDEDDFPSRLLAGVAGAFMLIFLPLNIADGEITVRGNHLSRADDPVSFWFMIASAGLVALAAIYFAFRRTTDDKF